jgi:probable F420-dependent oxidoreductase
MGFSVPTSGSWATPTNQIEVARRAEELGYASLWTFQRLAYPVAPDERDAARWRPVYRSVHDPLMTLAFLAAHTTRIRLGTAVLNMPFTSPILLAKQTATLDVLSGGRLDVGLGLGWAREEYAATGAPFDRRGARAEEFLGCLRALWTEDVVDFRGTFHTVTGVHVDPKPQQRPHPPLLLGGGAEAALRRVGRLADGWISASGQDLASMRAAIDVVREAAADAGRDPGALRFICRGVVRVRAAAGEQRRMLTGSLEQIRDDLADLAAQGVSEVFADLNFDEEIGVPEADPAASMGRAHEVLEALAPQPERR